MGVQARTLEFYRQLGIAEGAIALGVPARVAHLRSRGREVTALNLTDMGAGVSPYPYLLCLAQDVHERFLLDRLAELGVQVEWRTRLETFEQDGDGVTATLRWPDGSVETARSRWIVGCDGAHSAVRHALGTGFQGGTNEGLFYVADVDLAGEDGRVGGEIHASLDETTIALIFPVRTTGAKRVLGIVPRDMADGRDLDWEAIRHVPETALGVRATALHWFSTYRVSHRVADRFRVGRAFLAGDAGHIHSPVGGQGINTGIGDAINLGWKLADVEAGRADPVILGSYEDERIRFARRLIRTTDAAFGPMASDSRVSKFLRAYVVPNVARVALHLPRVPRVVFGTVSQTRIDYRKGALSRGDAGGVAAGDRLPWVADVDNFAPLRALSWQVHVYGRADAALTAECGALGLPVHVFAFSDDARDAGLARDAAYLVRPDGHVGFASAHADAPALRSYVRAHGLRFQGRADPAHVEAVA